VNPEVVVVADFRTCLGGIELSHAVVLQTVTASVCL
jgi:hypothetical protein